MTRHRPTAPPPAPPAPAVPDAALPVPLPRQPAAGPLGRRTDPPAPRPAATGPVPDGGPGPAEEPVALLVPRPAGEDATGVWELVHRTQAGDAEAFGLLYDRYVDVVFRFLLHRVADRALAEDLTSETFVRALRRIEQLSFQGRDVGAWLITIARNLVLDHVKSSRYRLEVPTADMRDADRVTDGPEDAVLQGLTHATVLEGVRQLSADQRECVELRFLQGLSVAETAAAMGRKDGAVKALQSRAVRRLAQLLPEGLQ